MNKPCYTVQEFCDAHSISKVHFYALTKQGRGPRTMRLGRRVLITIEAAAEWRARIERETAQEAA